MTSTVPELWLWKKKKIDSSFKSLICEKGFILFIYNSKCFGTPFVVGPYVILVVKKRIIIFGLDSSLNSRFTWTLLDSTGGEKLSLISGSIGTGPVLWPLD